VCVAAPLQQQTCDTISELQQKFVVYQSYGSSRINQKTNVCSNKTMVNQSYGSSSPKQFSTHHKSAELQHTNHQFPLFLSSSSPSRKTLKYCFIKVLVPKFEN